MAEEKPNTADDSSRRPGPEPERLRIRRSDWREAVREALEEEKPEEGWPEEVEADERADDAS